jgi:hypothetical protein
MSVRFADVPTIADVQGLQAQLDSKETHAEAEAAIEAAIAALQVGDISGLTADLAALTASSSAAEATATAAMPKSGGAFTGPVTLSADGATNLAPVTKQQQTAAINALVNGAPEALDTLKEISERLGLDESAEATLIAIVATKVAKNANLSDIANAATALANLGGASASGLTTEQSRAEIAEALKLAKASNLSDLASAATARTNLGLGSSATHPAGDFDAAGAAAAEETRAKGVEATKADLVEGKLKESELPSSVVVTSSSAEGSEEVPVSDGAGKSAWKFGVTDGGDYALDLAKVISAFGSSRAGVFVQALGKAMVGKTTNGSKLVEGVTSANTVFRQGQEVTGTHIPAGTYILGFTTSTTVELSQAATASEEGAALVAITDYFLIRGLGSSRYERVRLRNYRGSPGGYGLNQIYGSAVCLPMLTHNVVSPSTGITKSGTWTVTTGQPTPALGGPYNTAYSYSTTAGDYFQYETPIACTAVGMRFLTSINGGLGRVELDASRTAATGFPTALQLVEDGSYPNTILEEHGGTLKPTDRVVDCNQSDTETHFDRRVVVADGLASAKHTVKVLATGYASLNEDQTGVRTYITGFGYGPTETAITESTVDLYTSDWIMEPRIGSAWEYAIHQKPHGDAAANWTGNIHGHEVQDSLALSVDGVVSHPTAGTVTQASNYVSLVRHSHIVDAEEEATKVALSETTYRLDRRGLSVTPNLEWVKESVVDNAYSMCSVNGALNPYGKFNRGALLATPSILTLTGVGTGYVGLSKSGAAWMWGSTGRVAQLAYLVNAKDFTEDWQHTTVFSRIQDRGPTEPPACSKIYFPWVTPDAAPVTMKVGDRKTWTTRYMAVFASGGINTAIEAI